MIIDEDPLPGMISTFISCPEQDLDFLKKAILVGVDSTPNHQ